MGRSRYTIYEDQLPHFLTDTVLNWIPLFIHPGSVQIILDCWSYLQTHHQLRLYGYVVLENHLHWIAQAEDLPKEVHRFKAYTAKQLIQYLKANRVDRILHPLHFNKKNHKIDRDYQVWEEGSHPQLLQNEEMLRQKLTYLHNNPVKRGYVDQPEHWRYSSARNYVGLPGLLPVFTGWFNT
ncbi:hypothetical protein THII_0489 [Thioploca ingrica]|uniref:Transposase IS200-like domain-containing protein n=1 Tax=Thioploca ingrica TaxID=40754 RepID=A0A090BUA9_9GAMM|nr:hypothetical protein THII_0489 [Thioploca ingrica]